MDHKAEGTVTVCCHRIGWWVQGDYAIDDQLKKNIEEHVEERARECLIQEVGSGELNFLDPDTEHEYTGWWKIERG